MRSHAFGLLANSADDEEIAKALKPADLDALLPALDSAMAESAPADDTEVMAAVTWIVGLIGQDWSPSKKTEYIHLVTEELVELPGGMVLDALKRARKYVTAGRLLVPWIYADVEPKLARLKLERDRLTRLVDLALPAA